MVIYAVGLSGSDGVDASALDDWASKPSSAYVAITPDDAELEEIFADLAKNISNPGATNIVITDKVSSCLQPEHCPEPVDLTVDGCEDSVEFDAGDLGM